MKLHEYQSKQLFEDVGIPVPTRAVISSIETIHRLYDDFSDQVLLKAQVIGGGRGKTGGIRLVKSKSEAEQVASSLFTSCGFRHPIQKILMEELVDFDEGYLVGIYVNEKKGIFELMGSSSIKFWKNNRNLPEFLPELTSIEIDPINGVQDHKVRDLAISIGLESRHWNEFVQIVRKMWEIFSRYDAVKVEINPLAVNSAQRLISLGVKIEIDDKALFRHPEIEEMYAFSDFNENTNTARKMGFSYEKLDGEIGIVSNGRGLSLAALDMIKKQGGNPSGFIDLGNCVTKEKVTEGLKIFINDPKTNVVFMNIFGGFTSFEEISKGIILLVSSTKTKKPLIVRFEGDQKEAGDIRLSEHMIHSAKTITEAVKFCIQNSGGKREHIS